MQYEIRELVERLGITELQAYRHVKARREIQRSRPARNYFQPAA